MARPTTYPDELIARGVRLALESERPIAHIAADLGMHPETLREKCVGLRLTMARGRN
jgi:transposase